MATRPLSRAERREQTRVDLIAAADRLFVEGGFHATSLDQIAAAAGYTKGAVYSNFAGKDELFLAVLDAHFERRVQALEAGVALEDGATLEESGRAVARMMAAGDRQEPDWTPLLLEFWVHASRREDLREQMAARRRRFLEIVAELVEEIGRRHGVDFRLPAVEVARGSGALARGMAMERLLDPEAAELAPFEEMHAAYVTGLTKPPAAGADSTERKGR
jgi:AcrR family transcriptional regulator